MKHSYTPYLLYALTGTTLILLLKEWDHLLHLNNYFFAGSHDALKNYYTALYHIKWDKSYVVFEGMNYPYGEHVLFTDNQPLIANFLKFLKKLGIPSDGFAVAVYNALPLLGLLLCTLFNFLCLKALNVRPWLSAIAAVALCFLSPQIARLHNHFALSYAFVIPLMLYLAVLHLKKPGYRLSLFILLTTVLASFLHAYYFAFALLIFSVLFATEILKTPKKSWAMHLTHWAIQVLIPFLLVQGFMWFTDPFENRPSYPWSPLLGSYKLYGVFLPVGKPIGHWIHVHFGMPQVDWEAVSYIGGFASVFLFFALVSAPFFIAFKKPRKHLFYTEDTKHLFLLLISCGAMLIPLMYSVLGDNPRFFQLLGPVRQFRSATRFHWILFSAINLYAFSWLNAWLNRKKTYLKWLVPLLVCLVIANDAYWQSKTPLRIKHHLPLMQGSSSLKGELREILKDFDAIIPLPYFHIGSENFVFDASSKHLENTLGISYITGVPTTGVMLSRTSLNQTLNALAFKLFPLKTPVFAEQLKGKKVAVLLDPEASLSPYEHLLLEATGRVLKEGKSYRLLSFNLEKFLFLYESSPLHKQFAIAPKNAFFSRDYRVNHAGSAPAVEGKRIKAAPPRLLEEIDWSRSQPTAIELASWVYLFEQTKAFEAMEVQMLNAEGVELSKEHIGFFGNIKAIDGNWGYISRKVHTPAQTKKIHLSISENGLRPTSTYIKSLVIKNVPDEDKQVVE